MKTARFALIIAAIAVCAVLLTVAITKRAEQTSPVPSTQAHEVEKLTVIEVKKATNPTASTIIEALTTTKPLPATAATTIDFSNSKKLSTKKICHSYGVGKDGKPNQTSLDSQRHFDAAGLDAITIDTVTIDKVIYLTFDCGYENGYTAKILDTLKEKNVKAAFFCTLPDIKSEGERTQRIIDEGHILGNHSSTHPSFPEISRERMAKELNDFDAYLRANFNYSAPYFRFPKGEYSDSAVELVNSMGYKCVFWSAAYVDWNTDSQMGADYAFSKVTSRLHPGAVLLLHSVSSDNAAALGRIIDWAREQGYEFRSLDELPQSSTA